MGPPTLSIPTGYWGEPRPRKHHLMDLPEEILNMIFKLVLVEPRRWDKRHNAHCKAKITSPRKNLETPPFLQSGVRGPGGQQKTIWPCKCASRKGLGLLRTCRSVQSIANGTFWTMNTFCFLDARDFVATVGTHLAEQNQVLLRSVSIMNPDMRGDFFTACSPNFLMSKFVKALAQCTGLRQLEMPAAYLDDKQMPQKWMTRLAKDLPQLDAVHFNFLIELGYGEGSIWTSSPIPFWSDEERGDDMLYIGCSRPTLLRRDSAEPWSEDDMRELWRELRYNFYIHVIRAVRRNFLRYGELPRSVTDHDHVQRVKLDTGRTITVALYGLPASTRTRLAAFRDKSEQDRAQKIKDGLRMSEREAKDEAWWRQRLKREEDQAAQRTLHTEAVALRQRTRDAAEARAVKDARMERKKEQKAVALATERRIGVRRSERKKVLRL